MPQPNTNKTLDQQISEIFQRHGFYSTPIGMTTELKTLIAEARKETEERMYREKMFVRLIPDNEVAKFQGQNMQWIRIDKPGYYHFGFESLTTNKKEED